MQVKRWMTGLLIRLRFPGIFLDLKIGQQRQHCMQMTITKPHNRYSDLQITSALVSKTYSMFTFSYMSKLSKILNLAATNKFMLDYWWRRLSPQSDTTLIRPFPSCNPQNPHRPHRRTFGEIVG